MKRLSLVLAVPTSLLLAGSAWAANGCPTTPSTTYAPDNSAISVLFDQFLASPGSSANCNLSVSSNKSADTFAVYKATYTGLVDPGETAHFTVKQNGREDSVDVRGPKEILDNFYTNYIGTDGKGNIASEMQLSQSTGGGTAIDTVDYALAATMTRANAEASLADIGRGQTAMITHIDATSGLLTGGNMALTGPNEARIIGGIGSITLGGTVRYNMAEGLSLLSGVSLIRQNVAGADYTGVVGAAALRYVEPGGGGARLFGEVGANLGALYMSFTRTYTDSEGTHAVSGGGIGGLAALSIKGGTIWTLDANNEVALSASLKQNWLGMGNYAEEVSNKNYFAASLADTSAGFTTVKLGVDWTTTLTPDVSVTAHGAIGTTIANQQTTAMMMGGGEVTGDGYSTIFAEYGLGLAWQISSNETVEGFVQGSSGDGIGTHAQIGAGYRMKF